MTLFTVVANSRLPVGSTVSDVIPLVRIPSSTGGWRTCIGVGAKGFAFVEAALRSVLPLLVASMRRSQILIAPSVAPAVASFGVASSMNSTHETLCTGGGGPPLRFRFPGTGTSWALATMQHGRGASSRLSHTQMLPSRPPDAKVYVSSVESVFTDARCPRKQRTSPKAPPSTSKRRML